MEQAWSKRFFSLVSQSKLGKVKSNRGKNVEPVDTALLWNCFHSQYLQIKPSSSYLALHKTSLWVSIGIARSRLINTWNYKLHLTYWVCTIQQYKPEASSCLSHRRHVPSLPFSSPCLYLCVCLCVSLSCHLCVWFSPCLCVSFPRNLCAHCKTREYVCRREPEIWLIQTTSSGKESQVLMITNPTK